MECVRTRREIDKCCCTERGKKMGGSYGRRSMMCLDASIGTTTQFNATVIKRTRRQSKRSH